MTFQLSSIGNIFSMETVKKVFGSPFITAIIITLVVILIVYFVFQTKVRRKYNLNSMLLRTGIYILVVTAGALFLHNKVLLEDKRDALKDKGMEDVTNAKTLDPNRIQVRPDIYNGTQESM